MSKKYKLHPRFEDDSIWYVYQIYQRFAPDEVWAILQKEGVKEYRQIKYDQILSLFWEYKGSSNQLDTSAK